MIHPGFPFLEGDHRRPDHKKQTEALEKPARSRKGNDHTTECQPPQQHVKNRQIPEKIQPKPE
ncbi:hypothetical protein CEN49_06375 [Fischerella thermalis CCMEE 5273]|nr:hypothetical protein CEN49_06375 [Fischerella thermalis CCMEE 5273]